MKAFLKSRKGIVCCVLAAAVLLCCAAWGGYTYWLYQQPKFHDLSIELGTERISLGDFMTQYANAGKVGFVTDPGTVDLNAPGTQALTLRHGRQEQTVTLTIHDTVAPKAVFTQRMVVYANQPLPEAQALVSGIEDLSPCTVSFLTAPVFPEDYESQVVTLVVTDSSGNQTQGQCQLDFRWLLESLTLEYGESLSKELLLLNPERDGDLLDQTQLDEINATGIGSYTVTSLDGKVSCQVTVADTTPPVLELQSVERIIGRRAKLEDFVVSVEDLSGIREVRLLTQLDFSKEQTIAVVIEAEDTQGNITQKETTLHVVPDRIPPEIHGLTSMEVEKNSTPDYTAGVSARDEISGTCQFTYDDSQVDLTAAGTYYVTYRAKDAMGNTATYHRAITVKHDAADTAALVASIAAGLSSDPKDLRNYVRDTVNYCADWGGDDPVWYGFKKHRGNCYVHAKCLQVLLQAKGYETRIIHTTDNSHYWVLVNLNGAWKHMDATPGEGHGKYLYMSDAQRLETLNGRVWDTSLWPACE